MSSITGHDRDLELDELRRISNRTIALLEAHVFHSNGMLKMERYKVGVLLDNGMGSLLNKICALKVLLPIDAIHWNKYAN